MQEIITKEAFIEEFEQCIRHELNTYLPKKETRCYMLCVSQFKIGEMLSTMIKTILEQK